jgi:hypothetical protein
MNNSQNRKIKILCFTDTNSGRDVEMILPIRFFAEKFLNCSFEHAVSFDIYQMYKKKPDIVFAPNTIGSNLYFKIAQYAHEQNIPLFALISEGNFRTDGSFNYWGFNKDKKFFQEFVCAWSERTRQYLLENESYAKDKIVLTGGVGFDRYKIYKFADKEVFLQKYNKTGFKKIVGYAGWAFGKLQHKRGIDELLFFMGNDTSKLKWIEEQRCLVRDILKGAIVNNKDTLFILKKHPQENSPERTQEVMNEMSELKDYENVLYLGEEEPLLNLISVSDIWTCFESTTSMEAWLMGKQTVFLNPETDFKRDPNYKGSAIIQNYSQLQSVLDEYFNTGKIQQFFSEDKVLNRNELIKNVIGFGDGFNHIRASYYLSKTIENLKTNNAPQYKFNFLYFLYHLFTILGGLFYIRPLYKKMYKFNKHLWVFENYKMKEIEMLYSGYSPFLEEFYKRNQIQEKLAKGELFNSIFNI